MLIPILQSVIAQTKPTKEETITFINRTLSEVTGKSCFYGRINKAELSSTGEIFTDIQDDQKKDLPLLAAELIGIKWDKMDTEKPKIFVTEENIAEFTLRFTTKIKQKGAMRNGEKIDNYTEDLSMCVPKEKFESIWKAFLRLSEIVKAENKDPFSD